MTPEGPAGPGGGSGENQVRVLVLFAHPVETSFGAIMHAKAVEALGGRGHKVDDCDLDAEGFDPVMTRGDRFAITTSTANHGRGGPYVDRLLKADALVFSFRSGTWAFPRSSGLRRQGVPARRQLQFEGRRLVCPLPAQHQAARRGLHLRRQPLEDAFDGRSAPPVPEALHAPELRAQRACDYLALYDMDHTTLSRRVRFLDAVERRFSTW